MGASSLTQDVLCGHEDFSEQTSRLPLTGRGRGSGDVL